jgi:hypothetical protein
MTRNEEIGFLGERHVRANSSRFPRFQARLTPDYRYSSGSKSAGSLGGPTRTGRAACESTPGIQTSENPSATTPTLRTMILLAGCCRRLRMKVCRCRPTGPRIPGTISR